MPHRTNTSPTGQLSVSSAAGRWVIAATVLGSGMAAIDSTVVGIALPAIGREFDAPVSTLQWVVTGYTLTLSALLLTGGDLGDRFGRRKIFCFGVIWFTLASAACAVAPSAPALVLLRVVQGVGGALLTPGSLAILEVTFSQADRSRAIGAWTALGGVASAVGPFVGGFLVSAASWRWIFLINFPIGVFVLTAGARHIPESRDPSASGAVDRAGTLLGVVSLGGVTFGLIEGPSLGWSHWAVVTTLVAGGAAAAAFALRERRVRSPLLPLELFRSRRFSITNAVTFVVYAALGGILFLLPVTLQVVGGYSPLESGVALLPLTAVMLLFSSPSGRLAARIGPRAQMSIGPAVTGIGLALLGRISSGMNYWSDVLPAVLVFAAGLATTVAPLTATALQAAPEEHVGVASAVNNVVARVGGLIAVAVLPALAGIGGSSHLRAATLAGGFRTAALIAGGLCAAGGLLAFIGLDNPPGPRPNPPPGRVHCTLDATPLAVDVPSAG